jgi:hypothetical protein
MTSAARTGQTLAVLASSMLFAALTSAMVVRRGIGPDWSRPDLPPYAWAACAVLVASSLLARTGRTLAAALCGAAFLALQTALINSLSLGETAPPAASTASSASGDAPKSSGTSSARSGSTS